MQVVLQRIALGTLINIITNFLQPHHIFIRGF